MTNNKPLEVLRDGNLKVTLWANQSKKSDFFINAVGAKTYESTDGTLKDTHSFTGPEMLRIGKLMDHAYDRSQALMREHRQSKTQAQTAEAQTEQVPHQDRPLNQQREQRQHDATDGYDTHEHKARPQGRKLSR